ncbi:MAG: hypothetical protein IKE42_21350 [Aquamicrobium sp.]|uniref:hypothetical protein n=1 Tax=Mesorhizobium sp. Pch-S TaxID=2082387 RepID=UPI0010101ACF|nr:hypothetical protein [Mesorhizobium sp. Pch-S]MBR2690406.1 hypothetical protein [Aquamicrobium sp.]QAZ46542.1 hypothetical protein C1M53_30070 [Mesorhizobium sp. Pch-S]
MVATSKQTHTNGTDIQAALEGQLAELRREVAKLNKSLAARGAEVFDEAVDHADDAYRTASATAARAMRHLRSQAQSVSETARENPRATTAVVAVVGALALLAGMALARSHSGRDSYW